MEWLILLIASVNAVLLFRALRGWKKALEGWQRMIDLNLELNHLVEIAQPFIDAQFESEGVELDPDGTIYA